MTDFDDDNFLDNDEIEGVSAHMHEWTFEQALLGAVPLTQEEAVLINWNAPNPRHTSAVIRYIAKESEASFSVVTQTALVHGFSIFSNKHYELIETVSNLDDAAIVNGKTRYFDHLTYKVTLGKDIKRLPVRTDKTTAEAMGNIAAILGTSRANLAGACILMSLITAELTLPQNAKEILKECVDGFDIGVELYQKMAIQLV